MAEPDNGQRKRRNDLTMRQEEFRLLRDQVLLLIGVLGVVGITLSAILLGVKDPAITLASLTLFGTLLGAPTVLRLDERRRGGE